MQFALVALALLTSTPEQLKADRCKKQDATIYAVIQNGPFLMYRFCDGAKALAKDGKISSLQVSEAQGAAWEAFGSAELAAHEVAEHNARVLKTAANAAQVGKTKAALDKKQAAFRKQWSNAPYERAVKSCTLKPE